MTPLSPCLRCRQVLPVGAQFCRRCGLAQRRPAASIGAPARPATSSRALTVAVVASSVLATLALGVTVLFWVGSVHTAGAPSVRTADQVEADSANSLARAQAAGNPISVTRSPADVLAGRASLQVQQLQEMMAARQPMFPPNRTVAVQIPNPGTYPMGVQGSGPPTVWGRPAGVGEGVGPGAAGRAGRH
jgi:hypothetical protein